CNSNIGRRTETASTIMTAMQMSNAPAAATAMMTCRSPSASDRETSTNSSNPFSNTAAIGNTAFRAQLRWRLRATGGWSKGGVSAGGGNSASSSRIGVEADIAQVAVCSLKPQNSRAGESALTLGA